MNVLTKHAGVPIKAYESKDAVLKAGVELTGPAKEIKRIICPHCRGTGKL